ncbi:MAG: pyridoxamine 5'-phosphate oxidase family protein [Rhodospirillaceae bacterium]|nr:pyridoxamine 5'-phosphate oxidase family protein [Rhodospirillaceae bacterium]
MNSLRARYRAPSHRARKKVINRLDTHFRAFRAHSPFVVIGTSATDDGSGDVSPRGDEPGFVRIDDDKTILIPDRPSNNRLDTLSNIVENPEISVLFLIPGFSETLRMNGRAMVTDDTAVLARLSMGGKPALMAIRVEIREAYLHCNRAICRARLWDEDSRPDRAILPGAGRMTNEMTNRPGDR